MEVKNLNLYGRHFEKKKYICEVIDPVLNEA